MALCTTNTSLCSQFLCAKIEGVKAVESPDFMQHSLQSAGITPKNLLVDVTNYMCLDLGRPIHVYDADKVTGLLRATHNTGVLECLDGKTITLSPTDIVIADDSGPIGLAGIMGGSSTAVTDTSTNIIVEVALFDAIAIAQSGQHHNIISNARTRFERGVDPSIAEKALKKVIYLIVKYGGGKVVETDIKITPQTSSTVTWDPTLMKKLTGIDMAEQEMLEIFQRLGCTIEGTTITIPTWRHDLQIPEDFAEELLRVKGCDTLATNDLPPQAYQPKHEHSLDLTHLGLMECLTLSFTTREKAKLFDTTLVEVDNPISQDLSVLKPSLYCGLLDVIKHNISYGQKRSALYEVGKSYALNKETKMVVGLRHGLYMDRAWYNTTRYVDTFDAKTDYIMALRAFGVDESDITVGRDVPAYYHPHQSACFKQGEKILGYFGKIHPFLAREYGILGPCVGFELIIDAMPSKEFKRIRRKPYLAQILPKTKLDFSFVVDAHQETGHLCELIAKTPLVQDVSVFDVYTGPGIPEGKKAIAIQFVVQPVDNTLRDLDIKALMDEITKTVTSQFPAQLRTV